MLFPEIAKLMAIKRMTQSDFAKIIGCTQQAASFKLNGKSPFKREEMKAVREYFKDVAPSITMDEIFEENIFLSR